MYFHSYLCFQLPLLHSNSCFFFLYWPPSVSLCMVFYSILSNIDEVLSSNPLANVFVFGDFIVHHKDWLTYSGGNIVTRNNIVWKLAHSYCLCYCKTFLLVPDSTECTKVFATAKCCKFLCHLKSNNIIGQRKTTNKEKHFYAWLTLFNLKLSGT